MTTDGQHLFTNKSLIAHQSQTRQLRESCVTESRMLGRAGHGEMGRFSPQRPGHLSWTGPQAAQTDTCKFELTMSCPIKGLLDRKPGSYACASSPPTPAATSPLHWKVPGSFLSASAPSPRWIKEALPPQPSFPF